VDLSFRPLTEADFPLMLRWLTAPHVREWYGYGEPATLEGVRAHYASRVSGDDPTKAYVVLQGEKPIGYIQSYLIADHPEYARHVRVEPGAAGVDLFIGEPDLVHRGVGPAILRRFLREIVFADEQIGCCIIGPEPDNRAAIRAYEKVGFT